MHPRRNKKAVPSAFQISLVVEAVVYVALGINHFWHSRLYVSVMPSHYPHPHALVLISGGAEILGGIGLLFKPTRRFSAWGLILMLFIYFDVHVSMIAHSGQFPQIPVWLLYLRIPFQFILIAWAWMYTGPRKSN